ncbi:amino acid ABC transporter permease [Elioraea rosea]|uniref:amino acid ABC transporter permease n=1 Tax=Elioraea rosea TaxID=2492390 RepID=UPI001183A6AB|nr:amino acid ABC transporter permease [Elioraea rosea]
MELWGRRRGARLADAALLLLLAAGIGYVAWSAATTLRYNWNWSLIPGFLLRIDATGRPVPNLLLLGVFNTLRLAIWGMLGAAPIGLAVALMRLSGDRFLRLVGALYVELVRNTPALVLLFILYFFVSAQVTPLLGIDRAAATMGPVARAIVTIIASPPDLLVGFVSGAICLALFEGAFIAEVLRAGILSVERGQWEAGSSLGLSRWQVLRLVVVPQAVSRSLPPLGNQFIALVKESSIVSIVSIQDLTFMANEVAVSSGRVFEVWITTSVLYFIICFCLSLLFARAEARARRATR